MALDELKGPVVLDIPADPASMFIVRALVGTVSERIGFGREECGRLVLAVDEACTNVIRHAYKHRENERIILTFLINLDYFQVDIRDFGPAADPACFVSRELEDVRPGGLGIHFIKSAFDRTEYSVPEDGGMLLRLVKYRAKEETGQE
ncbi:MAG: ATP-binding protein [Syntrophobacter sp.]